MALETTSSFDHGISYYRTGERVGPSPAQTLLLRLANLVSRQKNTALGKLRGPDHPQLNTRLSLRKKKKEKG